VSRPDRGPDVAVDFSPPRRRNRIRPLAALVVVVLIIGAVTVAVTQLLLR
jgi:hypothetical protein